MQKNEETEPLPDFRSMSAHQLIDHLHEAFPHVCIRLGEPVEFAHRYAGRRELIDELLAAKQAELDASDAA